MKKRIHFLISKIQINLQNGDAFYAPFPFILQISKRKDRTSDSRLFLEIKIRKKITHNPEIPSITVLTPRRNRHLYSIPLAEAKLCSAAEKWPRRATLQLAGVVETDVGLVLVSRSKKWDATTRGRGGKKRKRERVAFRGWREIYWDALKFVAFMVRCVGTRSTGAGQRSTLIYASWKTLLTFCQETCVTKYSLEEKLLEVETLRLKRNGVCWRRKDVVCGIGRIIMWIIVYGRFLLFLLGSVLGRGY